MMHTTVVVWRRKGIFISFHLKRNRSWKLHFIFDIFYEKGKHMWFLFCMMREVKDRQVTINSRKRTEFKNYYISQGYLTKHQHVMKMKERIFYIGTLCSQLAEKDSKGVRRKQFTDYWGGENAEKTFGLGLATWRRGWVSRIFGQMFWLGSTEEKAIFFVWCVIYGQPMRGIYTYP